MKASNQEKSQTVKLEDILDIKDRDRLSIDPDEIQTLANSIKEVGLISPILLNKKDKGFEVVAGERRLLAHKLLGKKTIQGIVKVLSEVEVRFIRLNENIQRVDLTIIEEATIYFQMLDDHMLTLEQVAKKVGKSPGVVKRRIDLLHMPDCLIKALHKKQISYSVAEQLHRLSDVNRVEYLLHYAVDNGATQLIVRKWVDEEEAAIREEKRGAESGGGYINPIESKPVYLACDLCVQPTLLGEEKSLRICPTCHETIKKNM